MEPAEENAARQIEQVAGIPPEMRPRFDHFGGEDPQTEGPHPERNAEETRIGRMCEIGPGYVDEQTVGHEGEVDKGGEIYGVDAPWLCFPCLQRP